MQTSNALSQNKLSWAVNFVFDVEVWEIMLNSFENAQMLRMFCFASHFYRKRFYVREVLMHYDALSCENRDDEKRG